MMRGDVSSTARIKGARLHIGPGTGVAEVADGEVRDAAQHAGMGVLAKVSLRETR